MHTEDAVTLLNHTIYRPGWEITAREYDGSRIEVTFRLDTVDTSQPSRSGQYLTRKVVESDVYINVAQLNADTLLYEILRQAHKIDEHEDREFLRVRQGDGTFKAPVHPHTAEGDGRWVVTRLMAEGASRP